MKFLVAVPQVLLAEEIEAESAPDAVRGLRDSGGFAQALNGLGLDYEELLAGKNPVIATVVDPNERVSRWQMEIAWSVVRPEDVPF